MIDGDLFKKVRSQIAMKDADISRTRNAMKTRGNGTVG